MNIPGYHRCPRPGQSSFFRAKSVLHATVALATSTFQSGAPYFPSIRTIQKRRCVESSYPESFGNSALHGTPALLLSGVLSHILTFTAGNMSPSSSRREASSYEEYRSVISLRVDSFAINAQFPSTQFAHALHHSLEATHEYMRRCP